MRRPQRRRAFTAVGLLLLWLIGLWPGRFAHAQADDPRACAQAVLARLTPQERIGQIFLITFQGHEITPDHPVYDLIAQYRVGGVVLRRDNDNIPPTEPDQVPQAVQQEIIALQRTAWQTARQSSPGAQPPSGTFVPLLVALAQDGDGYPHDQILAGLTPLPSPLAIGATWQPPLAQAVGKILGRELAALGVNMLLGPPLDVAATPHPGSPGDLGTATFGGDPYWVGRMGQAFVQGVHQGGGGHLAVVVKHFPGYTGSDRSPQDEVATVRKSLEQLKQIELAPFFTVTDPNSDPAARADGLLVSHIRYQGFQGNIRATTRPVSLDPQALAQLMALQPFATWRDQGGVIVSDDLGSRAIRRFYDPTERTFNALLVARDALLAGNDLLYLGPGFFDPQDPDQPTTLQRTLAFFAQKYRSDPAFAQRVDAAATRVLTLKCRLYHPFVYGATLPSAEALQTVGRGQDAVFQVAQQAATLLSPAPTDLETVLPTPPQARERILFLADALPYRQCSECPQQQALSPQAFRAAVLRLYGPQGGAQVRPWDLQSLTFADLQAWLDAPDDHPEIGRQLQQADWVVVGLLDVNPQRPNALAFRRLLNQRANLLRHKKVVVFAFNAPYYLDATDISKLSAYYGLFSKAPPFVEVAARLLFRELPPRGALPVSVAGIGYDLITATAPDPQQVIPLLWDFPQPAEKATPTPTAEAGQKPLQITPGQAVPVRTGVILDHNGHPVPDGTVVRFLLSAPGGEPVQQSQETTTTDGVARATFQVSEPGLWEIRAQSDPARRSAVLQLVVPAAQGQSTPPPTVLPSPTVAPTLAPTPFPTPALHARPGVTLDDYFKALLVALLAAALVYRAALQTGRTRWGVRWGLLTFSGGMAGYLFLAARRSWAATAHARWDGWAAVLLTLLGALLGLAAGLGWWWFRHRRGGVR